MGRKGCHVDVTPNRRQMHNRLELELLAPPQPPVTPPPFELGGALLSLFSMAVVGANVLSVLLLAAVEFRAKARATRGAAARRSPCLAPAARAPRPPCAAGPTSRSRPELLAQPALCQSFRGALVAERSTPRSARRLAQSGLP